MKKVTAVLLTLTMLFTLLVPTYAAAFSDVGEAYDWAKDAIEKFSEEGIIEGKGGGLFAPDDAVTRAEFAKMLALTFDLAPSGEMSIYQDVADDYWAAPYIMAADEYTISIDILDESYAAMDTNNYAPERNATREEIAAALYNMIKEASNAYQKYLSGGGPWAAVSYPGQKFLKTDFSDYQDVNEKIYNQVEAAYEEGLIKGYDDGTLRPKDSVTRAEAVVFLDRARELKRYYEQQTPTPTPSVTPTATPTATPTSTPTATATPVATPKTAEDLISVVNITQTAVDGERCYALYYAFGGIVAQEPLIVSEDVEVGGAKTTLGAITCGDLLLFDTRANGRIRTLFVVYSPGLEAPSQATTPGDLIKFPARQNWKFSTSESRAYDSVYFGYLQKTKLTDEGVITYLEYGDYSDAALVKFDTARVSVYEAYQSSNEKRFKPLDASRLQDLYEDNGDLVFVRAKRDVITDVIVIDYKR